MSWKTAGRLISGAPSSSSPSGPGGAAAGPSRSLAQKYRPNPHQATVYERERQLAVYGSSEREPGRRSEWDVLKDHHRFIRPDERGGNNGTQTDDTWEDRLAKRYEDKLFKEFALIDLKHYKSRRYALRWRTAPEVVNGLGEDTCASLRCKHHQPFGEVDDGRAAFNVDTHDNMESTRRSDRPRRKPPTLRTFELPFAYVEQGAKKEALVKVRLCGRCERKLRWRPDREGMLRESEDDESAEEERDRAGRARRKESRRSNSPEHRGSGQYVDEDKRERDKRRRRDDQVRRRDEG